MNMTLHDVIYELLMMWSIVTLTICAVGVAVSLALRLARVYKPCIRAAARRHINRRRHERAMRFANRPNGYHEYRIRTR